MPVKKAFENYFAKAVTSVADELDRWIESFDPLKFSRKYTKVLKERHSKIKILGMSKPVDLSSIYIDIITYKEIPSRLYVDYEALEEYMLTYDRHNMEIQREKAQSFVKKTNRALFLGKPGSGKTTFLKYLVCNLLSESPLFSAIPIYVPLKEYSDSPYDNLLDYIVNDFEKFCNFPSKNSDPFLNRILKNGHAVLLLDGLDEVEVSKRKNIISEIEKNSSKFIESKIFLSCRTADYQGWFGSFEEVEIADFTPEQARKFIKQWFQNDPQRSKFLIAAYESSHNIRELCSVPLMSALLCILFQYNLKLPGNRSELYSECIDSLLYKWDASRLITRETNYENLSTQKKKVLFSNVAKYFMEKQKVVFSEKELLYQLKTALKPLGISSQDSVLKEISANHGLLLERSAGYWSFIHLTFQEFFTALNYVQNRTEQELVQEHIFDPRWREVIIMVSSLLPDVEIMVEKATSTIFDSKLFLTYSPYFKFLLTYTALRRENGNDEDQRLRYVLGLKESKDIIDDIYFKAEKILNIKEKEETRFESVSTVIGKNRINQIKALRQTGTLLNNIHLLPKEIKKDFEELVSKNTYFLQHNDIEQIIKKFGPLAFDKFWMGYSELFSIFDLYFKICFQDVFFDESSRKKQILKFYKQFQNLL